MKKISEEIMENIIKDIEVIDNNKIVPANLIGIAQNVADACKKIVMDTAITIQKNRYIPVESWEAIATAHGCHIGSKDTERVYDNNKVIGWKAIASVYNNQGIVIGTGEGFVGKDEKHWKNALEYACRAMAQTRAISRAARSVFAHVVVMMQIDSLSTTPYEEITEENYREFKEEPKKELSKEEILKNDINRLCGILKYDTKKFIEFIEFNTGKKSWKELTDEQKQEVFLSLQEMTKQKDN